MRIQDMFDLSGKVAIITGGGRGIGYFISKGMAESGASVVIASRKLQNCEKVASEIRYGMGVKTMALKCDLRSEEEISNLVEVVVKNFKRIDILVNNSGSGWLASTLEYPIDKWDRVMNINVRGPWILTQKVARVMKDTGGGKIIFVSSIMGMRGASEKTQPAIAYNASKGALNAMTMDLAVKWAPYGIYVNAVAPGSFKTEMTSYYDLEEYNKVRDIVLSSTPLGRQGGEDDIKGVAVFLASDASNFITGQIITVDGGSTVLAH
jgi:NAD(P)-dependent dehydrogenase (short-subunit alcohol dehydrogenase family)